MGKGCIEMKPHETGTDNPIDFPKQMNNERSLAAEITEGFEALKKVRELEELKATVRSFFEDFIDIREESDSGRVFAPITISSCRCMMIEPLADVLAKMRTLSGAKKRSEK
jgi:hypothetical protein